jgi:hypothetical protein
MITQFVTNGSNMEKDKKRYAFFKNMNMYFKEGIATIYNTINIVVWG